MNLKRALLLVLCFALLFFGYKKWQHGFFPPCAKATTSNVTSKNISVLAQLHAKEPSAKKNVAVPSPHTIAFNPSPLQDPSEEELREFPEAVVVESAEIEGPEPGEKTRLRILKTHFKYPFIRTEEVIDATNNGLIMRQEMVASHLLVTLPEGEDPEQFLKRFGSQAVSIVRVTPEAPLYRVILATASLEALPRGLEKVKEITTGVGEPDGIAHARQAPNNPFFHSRQWAFWDDHYGMSDDVGGRPSYPGANIQKAWDIRTDASSVIVAVIDSGIRYTHEGLADNMWKNPASSAAGDLHGWNAYDNNGDPLDHMGHGTHCAGTIGAVGNNGKGVAGICWKVQLMACKYFDSGSGTCSDVIVCVDYALDHGAQILNCSFGSYSWSFAEYEAFKRAHDKGVIAVCAAGNDAGKFVEKYFGSEHDFIEIVPHYPACYQLDNIVNVAALSETDTLASYSNWGATIVHLAAPGDNIFSTWGGPPDDPYGWKIGTGDSCYAYMDGTSCAAPFVTGALALLKAQFPNDSYQLLIARLLAATDPVPALKGKVITGGRLDIYRALTEPAPKVLPQPGESWAAWFYSWSELQGAVEAAEKAVEWISWLYHLASDSLGFQPS